MITAASSLAAALLAAGLSQVGPPKPSPRPGSASEPAPSSEPRPRPSIREEERCLPPRDDVIPRSNCSDPDGPGQGELQAVPSLRIRLPDLVAGPSLQLGNQQGHWGGLLQLPALPDARGDCRVLLTVHVENQGDRASAPTRHQLRQRPWSATPVEAAGSSLQSAGPAAAELTAAKVLAEIAQGPLNPDESQRFEVPVRLSGGSSWLEFELNFDAESQESDRSNNLRRLRIEVPDACR